MKRLALFMVILLVGSSCVMYAQTENQNKQYITVTNQNGDEEDIDLPEGMDLALDSLIHVYNVKTYLKPDTSCQMKNYNPSFPQEVFIDRLKKMPTIIEMPYNNVVQKFIDKYSNDLRKSVSYMLGASNFYIPIFEEALEAYNLPLELK
jgi:membrane-bound lytic murein transglycosylase D